MSLRDDAVTPGRVMTLPRYLTAAQVCEHLPYTETSLWRMVQHGEFPAPIKLSAGRAAWREDHILAWLNERELASSEARAAKAEGKAPPAPKRPVGRPRKNRTDDPTPPRAA